MPEPVQSAGRNMCVYDASQDVCSAPPAPTSPQTTVNPPPASAPGVTALVNKHPPAALQQCLGERVAVAVAAGNLVRAAGGMAAASPTVIGAIPAITSFIGSAIIAGAAAAALANCEEGAAVKTKAK